MPSNEFDINSLIGEFDESSLFPTDVTRVVTQRPEIQATIGQAPLELPEEQRLQVAPSAGGFSIENPKFYEQSEEDQKRALGLLNVSIREGGGRAGVYRAGLQPPTLPYGKTLGAITEFGRGLNPFGSTDPRVPGESPTLSGIAGLGGEVAKYALIDRFLKPLKLGFEATMGLTGLITGAGRQVSAEDPSLENVLVEGVAAAAIPGLGKSISAGLKGSQWTKFVDDVISAKPTQQLRTEQVSKIKTVSPFLDNTPKESVILNSFGYNPEVAKALQDSWGKIVDKSWAGMVDLIPDRISRFITDKLVSPAPSAARQVLKEADLSVIQGKRMADEIAESIRLNVPKEFHDDVFRTLDPTAFGDIGSLPLEFRSIAKIARDKIDELGKQYAELGIISDATFSKNVGEYLGRYYKGREEPLEAVKRIFKRRFIKGERGRHRVLKTAAEREKAGLITDPMYAVSRTIGDLTFDIANANAFRKIAQNPEWAQPYERFPTASEASRSGFVHLPKNPAYGDLSNMWVEKGIVSEINAMIPNYSKGLSQDPIWREAVDLYDIMLTSWKYGKTALNPATHGRNIFSNVILADFGGLSPRRIDIYAQATREYAKKGVFYKEAAETGLFGTDWFGSEIKTMGKAITKSNKETMIGTTADMIADSKFGSLLGKPGRLYQAEEHFFKMALFVHRRKLGDTPALASAHAQKYLFNYSDLSPFLKKLRRSPLGGPFLSFTVKSIPVIAETAAKHPIRFFKYPAMFSALNEISKVQIGMTDEEYKQMQESLPEWQKNTWLTPKVLLPIRGQEGSPRVLDLTYNLPWGQIGEQGKLLKNIPFIRDIPGLSIIDPLVGSNPFANLVAEGIFNKKLFTGREIFNRLTDTNMRALEKFSVHAGRQLAPGIVLNIPAVISAFKGDVNRFGDKYDPLSTALSKLAGIKIIDVNIDKNTELKVVGLNMVADELIKEAYRVGYDQSLTEDEKRKEVEYFKSQMEILLGEYKKLGLTFKEAKQSRKKIKKLKTKPATTDSSEFDMSSIF